MAVILVTFPPHASGSQGDETHAQDTQKPVLPTPVSSSEARHNEKSHPADSQAPPQDESWTVWGVVINGLLVLVSGSIAIAGWIQATAAKHSAEEQRATARLTQIADVLLEDIILNGMPGHPMSSETKIVLNFRNFGPTRASELIFDFSIKVGDKTISAMPKQLPIVLGALEVKPMMFERLGTALNHGEIDAIQRGMATLSFVGRMSYIDVFRNHHWIECGGDYNPQTGGFNMRQTKTGD